MRISDWSSGVCSSDLEAGAGGRQAGMPTGKDGNGRKHERAGALSPPAFSLTFSNREALCAGFGSSGDSLAVALVEAEEMRLTPNVSHVLAAGGRRSEEHTSELQSLMRISYAVFCLKKKT